MKKLGDLMKEAGFNPQGSDGVKEAFLKHLIKASAGVHVITPSEQKEIAANPQRVFKLKTPHQLSFDFIQDDPKISPRTTKKASTF